MRHLILGNGAAGFTAAGKLRELCPDDEITVVSGEEVGAYSKIMLPDYIGGRMEREKLLIRDETYYKEHNIRLVLGEEAVCIDTAGKKVIFSGSGEREYDRLLIAVGGVPFVPSIPGLDRIRAFTINSMKDADTIRNSAIAGETAIVMGGGLTGVEMAFALSHLRMKVYLVEREQNLLPQQLDEMSTRVMTAHLEKEGIRVLTGKTVGEIQPPQPASVRGGLLPRKGTAILSDGESMPFSMLVVAIGTRPNTVCIQDEEIKCRRGILVDQCLKTSAEGVFAAGDVAEPMQGLAGGYVSAYVWPNAMAQGKCAAVNMAGTRQEFAASAYAANMVQLRDMPFTCMGLVKPQGPGYETQVKVEQDGLVYKKLVLKGDVVRGMILIGDTSLANTISGIIRKEANVADFKDRLLEDGFQIPR